MPIFDSIVRVDASAARHNEGTYAFLNRAAGEPWESIRRMLEEWLANFPAEARNDLGRRLQSSGYREFAAAYWELYLHETLSRAGYALEVHPSMPHTTRRPDFLVDGPSGSFYLEARRVSESDTEIAAEQRRNQIYDSLDRISLPDFFLWIEIEEEGASSPPTKHIRRKLEAWISQLDADMTMQNAQHATSREQLPSLTVESRDWTFKFFALPRQADSRGKPARPLGVFGGGAAGIVDESSDLRGALFDKGTAYGALKLPLVVALSRSALVADDWSMMNALYGTDSIRVNPDGSFTQFRAGDGYWLNNRGWQNRGVVGILTANNMAPWRVVAETPTLWEHPMAELNFSAPAIWRRKSLNAKGAIETIEAPIQMSDLLGLPSDWPPAPSFKP